MTYILDLDASDDDDGPRDKWLTCVDCGADFLFDRDSGEGLIFGQRGWSLPTRCRGCRRQAADRRLRVMPDRHPRCPKCGEDRLVERAGRGWFCVVCAHDWRLKGETDRPPGGSEGSGSNRVLFSGPR